jgi:putative heme-binding domain-containing protein
MTALGMVPGLQLPEATTSELLASVLGRGSVQEQQSALAALGKLQSPTSQRVLGEQLDRLIAGGLPAEVQLDLMEAVEASNAWELSTRLSQYQEATPEGNPMAAFRAALHGGDADRGGWVVFENEAAQCTRCHSFGARGADAGPNLSSIGARLTREQLLESLVEPSARIAPGYGIVSLTLQNGETVAGLLREETESHLVVQTGSDENPAGCQIRDRPARQRTLGDASDGPAPEPARDP